MVLLGLFITLSLEASTTLLWGLHDVSVLFPLPENVQGNQLLKASDNGKFGELLPLDYLLTQNDLIQAKSNHELYKNLVAVGFRFDPELRHLKLILQPLISHALPWEPAVSTEDAGVHIFYQLTEDEFKNFLEDYLSLKKAHSVSALTGPLTIHPVLQAEQMKGSFSKALKNLLLKNTGAERIVQFTTMQLTSLGGVWTFTGMTVADGKLTPIVIPRLHSTSQEFTNVGRGDYIAAEVLPAPKGLDVFVTAFKGKPSSPIEFKTVMKDVTAAVRIENPRLHDSTTLDCVSCHTAQGVQVWANKYFADEMGRETLDSYTSSFNLSNLSPDRMNLSNLRAFGYLRNEMAINQRVINESADVASRLNSAYKKTAKP